MDFTGPGVIAKINPFFIIFTEVILRYFEAEKVPFP
jgi:hypothetical protein